MMHVIKLFFYSNQ